VNWLIKRTEEGIFALRAQWENASADHFGEILLLREVERKNLHYLSLSPLLFKKNVVNLHLGCSYPCASKRIDYASVSQSRRVAARPIAAAPATATAKHLRAIDATETAILVGGRWLHLSALSRARARGALPLACRALSQSLLDITSLC
jgi:hypothetical protein